MVHGASEEVSRGKYASRQTPSQKSRRTKTTFPLTSSMRAISTLLLLLLSTNSSNALTLNMVEGHSVHRIASRFRTTLVGRKFAATSPNSRFVDGASVIDGRLLSRMEAVGKNLFAFFSDDGDSDDEVVVHGKFATLNI